MSNLCSESVNILCRIYVPSLLTICVDSMFWVCQQSVSNLCSESVNNLCRIYVPSLSSCTILIFDSLWYFLANFTTRFVYLSRTFIYNVRKKRGFYQVKNPTLIAITNRKLTWTKWQPLEKRLYHEQWGKLCHYVLL